MLQTGVQLSAVTLKFRMSRLMVAHWSLSLVRIA